MAFIAPLFSGIGSVFGSGAAGAAGAGAAGAGAAVGAATGGFSIWQGLGLVSSFMSGFAQMDAANAQAQALEMQATNATIQGNQKALEYRRQGIQVLERVKENDALIRAKGGAGGIDPYSGSMSTLAEYGFGKGIDEFNWAVENQQFAKWSGEANAAGYRAAAASTRRAGMANLIGTGLMGIVKFGSSGGFG